MPIPGLETYTDSDKDAIVSTPRGEGRNTLITVNQYCGKSEDWHGSIIEETSAFRSDVELFYDLHTLLWDEELGQTLDVRNDAAGSDVSYESPRVPEAHLRNDFVFADGSGATLEQDVVASVDTCGLLVRNRVAFEAARPHTLYTVLNLGIKGHDHDAPEAVQEAAVRHEEECDLLVATDGDRHMAVAQLRTDTGQRRFDGHRVGIKGRSEGPDRSAWADIYEENDGYIDATDRNYGTLDAGVGLYVDDDTEVEWLTAVGFGKSQAGAVDHATSLLAAGYEAEREAFVEAWEAWHEGVSDGPTDDGTANDLYELSLTSLKCAEDPCGAMIAGAFKPHNMTYKFIWPRDQVVIVQALLAAGAEREARDALDWFDRVQIAEETYDDRGIDREGTWWQNYYATGEPHWRALQLDQVGGPIYAHWLLWTATGDDAVLDRHYDMSRRAAGFLLEYDNGYGFPRKHQDPWEETWGYSTEGVASAVAGLRAMADMAEAAGDGEFARDCRERAGTWAGNLTEYCFKSGTPFGDHFVTADDPETPADPAADIRPDAAAFMAAWPWNVVPAGSEEMVSTVELADSYIWRADESPCLGRYPGDVYTPTGTAEDGGWPLCEAYADVVRWQSGIDPDAVAEHVLDHAAEWTTAAGLLPERVDGSGQPRWNANLQWSQATYVLLAESHVRGEPYGLAPPE